ncbi:hypothetical protein BD309DRAFT_975671 [Dichomitus squalens]|nr:hypothetical protein BD309DRAFT_975671 [Dichomitus squalens]
MALGTGTGTGHLDSKSSARAYSLIPVFESCLRAARLRGEGRAVARLRLLGIFLGVSLLSWGSNVPVSSSVTGLRRVLSGMLYLSGGPLEP